MTWTITKDHDCISKLVWRLHEKKFLCQLRDLNPWPSDSRRLSWSPAHSFPVFRFQRATSRSSWATARWSSASSGAASTPGSGASGTSSGTWSASDTGIATRRVVVAGEISFWARVQIRPMVDVADTARNMNQAALGWVFKRPEVSVKDLPHKGSCQESLGSSLWLGKSFIHDKAFSVQGRTWILHCKNLKVKFAVLVTERV